MKVYGNLERASIEALSSDPSQGVLGRIWWNTTSGLTKTDDGTNIRALLRNDAKAVIGNNGTANSNIRLHRGAAGVLQFVTGGDATAEGTLSTSLNQISFRAENYATAGLPAAASAGRLIWNTDLSTFQADTGAAIKDLVIKDLAQVITNKDIDGGTAANNRRITLPGDTKTNLDSLTRKAGTVVYGTDTQKAYLDNGSILKAIGSGSGSGVNYILNPDAEVDTTGWATYADAAAVVPVDGTGGSPSSTWTRSTSNPLREIASFIFTKSANNRQGEGVSYAFTIDNADKNKILSVQFDHEITSGTFVTGDSSDIRVFIYDVTNSTLITPTNYTIQSSPGTFQCTFPATSSTSYRLILHVATTSALAYVFKADNVQVGPQASVYGPAMSDYVRNTGFTYGSIGTVTNESVFIKRVGDSLQVRGYLITGTVSGSAVYIQLPTGYSIDVTKLTTVNQVQTIGIWRQVYFSSDTGFGVTSGTFVFDTAQPTRLYLAAQTGSNVLKENLGTDIFNSGDGLTFEFSVPIQGWAANVASSNSNVFSISNILANGTRVTGAAPTQLGQYRSYLRDSGAQTYTETNGSPTTAPSSSNGVKLYNGNGYGSADSNNEPSRYEIFVGKNKTIRPQFYASTAKTGYASNDIVVNATTSYGTQFSYDPTTGIVNVAVYVDAFATTQGGPAFDGLNVPLATDIYFDIVISENALAVQQASVRSEVWVTAGNGHGGTNTKIRRFSNLDKNVGSAITYADSAANGASFTINEDGVYAITYMDYISAGSTEFGASLNSSQLTTSIGSITRTDIIFDCVILNTFRGSAGFTTNLKRGDVVRPHTSGTPDDTDATYNYFKITKVSN